MVMENEKTMGLLCKTMEKHKPRRVAQMEIHGSVFRRQLPPFWLLRKTSSAKLSDELGYTTKIWARAPKRTRWRDALQKLNEIRMGCWIGLVRDSFFFFMFIGVLFYGKSGGNSKIGLERGKRRMSAEKEGDINQESNKGSWLFTEWSGKRSGTTAELGTLTNGYWHRRKEKRKGQTFWVKGMGHNGFSEEMRRKKNKK